MQGRRIPAIPVGQEVSPLPRKVETFNDKLFHFAVNAPLGEVDAALESVKKVVAARRAGNRKPAANGKPRGPRRAAAAPPDQTQQG